MIAAEFLDQVQKLRIADYAGFEDFADKFNFLVTVLVIMMCTMVVTVKQYMLKPISCYMATDIGGRNLLDYVENYCWVQGTIPISFSDNIPDTEAKWLELNEKKILYYQWVPFVLGLQCILFYLPRIFWQMICQNKSGTDMQHIITMANEAVNSPDRKGKIKQIANILARMLNHLDRRKTAIKEKITQVEGELSGNVQSLSPDKNGEKPKKQKNIVARFFRTIYYKLVYSIKYRHQAKYLTINYGIYKIMYLGNTIGQLFLMQRFLGFSTTDSPFGMEVFRNMYFGKDWQITNIFPRVAYCITPVSNIGSKKNYATAQCVLPLNMLNEKIYVFLWWWITLIACINVYALITWFSKTITWKANARYMKKIVSFDIPREEMRQFEMFLSQKLSYDGVLLFRRIKDRCGEMICSKIIKQMYESNKEKQAELTSQKIIPKEC